MRKLCAMLAAILLLAGLCGCAKNVPDVGFIADRSYFMDYTIDHGAVQIRCVLSLVNKGSETCRIRIYGDFTSDVGTLLQEERLVAVESETGEEVITLEPGVVREVGVIFTGEFGGSAVKNNRNLPALCWEDADNPGKIRTLQAYIQGKNR